MTLKKVIFDTSAVRRFCDGRKGADTVGKLLEESLNGKIDAMVSALSVFEFLFLTGLKDLKKASEVIEFLKASRVRVIEANGEYCSTAARMRIKYSQTNLSAIDSIIIATGIKEDAELITSDKEWQKVKEAKVLVV